MTESKRVEKIDNMGLHKILLTIFSLLLIYDFYHSTTPIVVRIKDPQFNLLGPYNSTELKVDDVYDQLIDIKKFTFTINPQPCENYTEGLLLLIIVTSNPNNSKNRMVIRNTWGKSIDSTKVVFLVGKPENATLSLRILDESATFGDIVQGSFVDAYRNMTYKHVMGLKWVSHHCPTAKYVLKTDDDVVVNSYMLRQFLARQLSPWGVKKLITCQVLEHAVVQRTKDSKWNVSPEEYAPQYYPTYCAGWAILYSQDVVPLLLKAAQSTPYFWIDDVHVTGIVAQKIGVARTPLSSLILSQGRVHLLKTLGPKYAGEFIFGPPDLSVERISEIWRAIPE